MNKLKWFLSLSQKGHRMSFNHQIERAISALETIAASYDRIAKAYEINGGQSAEELIRETPPPAPPEQIGPGTANPFGDTPAPVTAAPILDYSGLQTKELQELCIQRSLVYGKGSRKNTLIKLLQADDAAKAAVTTPAPDPGFDPNAGATTAPGNEPNPFGAEPAPPSNQNLFDDSAPTTPPAWKPEDMVNAGKVFWQRMGGNDAAMDKLRAVVKSVIGAEIMVKDIPPDKYEPFLAALKNYKD